MNFLLFQRSVIFLHDYNTLIYKGETYLEEFVKMNIKKCVVASKCKFTGLQSTVVQSAVILIQSGKPHGTVLIALILYYLILKDLEIETASNTCTTPVN